MEYGKAFTYPQQDPNWIKKFVIGGLLYFVPVVGQLLVAGYGLEITRRVIENDPQLLPEWTDWGNLFKKGLYVLVVGLVYALPILLIGLCLGAPMGIAISTLGSSSSSDNSGTLGTVISVAYACMSCLIFLYAIFMGVVLPAAMGRVAATGQLGAAFKFGEVIALVRSKLGIYFIVMLVSALAIGLLSSLGSVACGIGAAFGAAYGLLVSAYLHGQAYLAPATAK
jgi:hypothetical protein